MLNIKNYHEIKGQLIQKKLPLSALMNSLHKDKFSFYFCIEASQVEFFYSSMETSWMLNLLILIVNVYS